ncbi:MAG: ABC transporter substrate-binding protein, partial [Candidatus Binataceae bacterium]
AGMVMVNHGGAADDLYDLRHRMLVGVATPASDYFRDFARLVSTLKFFRKRIATVSARTAFARAVTRGFEHACSATVAKLHGVRIRLKYNGRIDAEDPPPRLLAALRRNRINVLASAGGFAHDLAVVRMIIGKGLNVPVLACVAAGVHGFFEQLGDEAEGIVGPSQWEENLDITPAIGPNPDEFVRRMRAINETKCDYPAAQAYAAGLLTMAALQAADRLDQNRLREAFSGLRTTTLFGGFAIDAATGRQISHKMLLVQWHAGRKVVIDPEPRAEAGALEFPSGWRLLLASFQILRLKRETEEPDEIEGDEKN